MADIFGPTLCIYLTAYVAYYQPCPKNEYPSEVLKLLKKYNEAKFISEVQTDERTNTTSSMIYLGGDKMVDRVKESYVGTALILLKDKDERTCV